MTSSERPELVFGDIAPTSVESVTKLFFITWTSVNDAFFQVSSPMLKYVKRY